MERDYESQNSQVFDDGLNSQGIDETQQETQINEEVLTVEELLISCVEARPPLWDSRLSIKDRSRTVRDNLWLEIYNEFGSNPKFPVEFLMKKWRNLRDTFIRIKGEYCPSGSAAKKKKKWAFFDSMQFLNDTVTHRPTVTYLVSGECSQTSTPLASPEAVVELADSLESQSRLPPKKRERSEIKMEGAILDALERVNAVPEVSPLVNSAVNPICVRISNLIDKIPEREKTLLEIKLLQIAYDGAKTYLH